ncbi:PREDICTED: isoflavone reductase homolog isoform X2 [Populus euphratica]|uniref:Isoflavone reductase homolog isoform X2 n=1 Tax=Populus euphratica TaxID=75702 RepID=A0AAJ6SXC4_POPEU|nr:PREDICTED: isoflavone reductase homolog isoform X2 [Populus euphratica]
MAERSRILFIGGTGYIGKFIVEASVKAGHPTFVLIRKSTLSSPAKSTVINNFKNLGVNLLLGDLSDHGSLVKAIKQVDVVISTVAHDQLYNQDKIIAAIKEAGNIKRFFPSEFGNDVDRAHAVEPAKTGFATKAKIRRAIEAEGIPYTYVASNSFSGFFLPALNHSRSGGLWLYLHPHVQASSIGSNAETTLKQPGAPASPRDKVVILGDGDTKDDIATYTIKAVDDPRAVNKTLFIKPPSNIISSNDLVSLWEKKVGKKIERIYVHEEQLLKNIQEASGPRKVILSICHSLFVKGDQTNFEIEPSFGVKASELYPDVKYTTVAEYLNQLF